MITPLLHRIIVKQHKLEEINKDYVRAAKAGIIIPDHEDTKRAQAGVYKATVISIGPTAYRDFGTECPIKVGDTVAFARFSGMVIDDENGDYVALNDEDVVAVLTKEEND